MSIKRLPKFLQAFGDSQVLGLDIQKIEDHYLHNTYKKYNFIIYAAPNNGPYEVINFLNKNKIILKKKILLHLIFLMIFIDFQMTGMLKIL